MPDALQAVLAASAPASASILLAAMGGAVNRQGGIVNVGLEAKMLAGAFVAVICSAATGSSGLGALAAAVAGALVGWAFSSVVTRLGANEIVAGLGLNLAAVGLFGYLLPVAFGVSATLSPPGLVGLPLLQIPLLDAVPFLGPVLSGHDPLTYVSWMMVPLTWLLLYRTTWGVSLRATGADEEAARAAGIRTLLLRDLSTTWAGALAGLGGAQLSLGLVQLFNKQMTGGRGFIALAAFYFGDARPGLTALAALVFGVFEAASFRLQGGELAPQLVQMLPYLAVVVSLLVVGARRRRLRRRRELTPEPRP